jgi:uncharacterized iron-regulated membrane protein
MNTTHGIGTGPALADPAKVRAVARPASLYARVWRWHFFAGLLCLPVLMSLAITGSLYLFRDQINDALYQNERIVQPGGQQRTLQELIARVLREYPGEVKQILTPAAENRSLQLTLAQPQGERVMVWINPYTAQVLGARAESRQWEMVVRQIHSLTLVGTWANWLVEVVAGWTLVLGITGLYLWWPRGSRANLLSVRENPGQRLWWRDVHALAGVIGGSVILFLALTGMPWSAVWGQQFAKLTKSFGLGLPAFIWDGAPKSDIPLTAQGDVPWTLETATLPQSAQSPMPARAALGFDRANEIFAKAGMEPGYVLRAPWDPTGVYTALQFPADTTRQRIMHVDQYSGRILIDTGYPKYGAVAKVIEWGTSIHQGRQFGVINQLVMLAGCVSLLLLAFTSVAMWWKRRPPGKLAAPPRPRDAKVSRNVLLIGGGLGIIFPLLGASMLLVVALDTAVHFLLRQRQAI